MIGGEAARKEKKPVTVDILGVSFSTLDFAETVQHLAEVIKQKRVYHVVTANPEIVMAARTMPEFAAVLRTVDLITPDGTGIVWAAQYLNKPVKQRVPGYDLLHALMSEADKHHWRVFLLGASEEINRSAYERLAAQYPGAKLVGRHHGYFRTEEEGAILESIERARPDLLFVGLGAPRQEIWISRHRSRLNVPVMMGIGGSLDVLAGKLKRAPKAWQRLRIEWLYRLLQQPSRWRRMLALPKFVFAVRQIKLINFRKKV